MSNEDRFENNDNLKLNPDTTISDKYAEIFFKISGDNTFNYGSSFDDFLWSE